MKRIKKETEVIEKYENVKNKEIQKEIKKQLEINSQEKLLRGQGTVEVNGIKREFKHGLIEAFPKAVSLLDQSQSENKRLKEERCITFRKRKV